MRRFTRLPTPTILLEIVENKERWAIYGERYTQKRAVQAGFEFKWPTVNKKPINQHILPTLLRQTQEHCSYCDGYPLDAGDTTIDHFQPKWKSDFYSLVCHWKNLYIACNRCQEIKNVRFDNDLLRPDSEEYMFGQYFVYVDTNHEIIVNTKAQEHDKNIAALTIEFFDLNSEMMKIKRRRAYAYFYGPDAPEIDDCDFRYMFDGLI